MATTADTKKTLEEFDNRARELLQLAELNKKKDAKKRAKPTPKGETKKVVAEQKDQVPANEAHMEILTGRALLPYVINTLAKKLLVAPFANGDDALRFVLRTITPSQHEKLQSIFTPRQMESLNKALDVYQKMRLDELLELFRKRKQAEALR